MFEALKAKMGFDQSKEDTNIYAPVKGRAVPLSEVPDPTFAEEMLGKGVAIVPEEGKVVSPVDGTIGMLFETKHAVTINADFGAEILVHVGLDTVSLKGQHYVGHVTAGDKVKKGDLLISFDMEQIKEAGYNVITPIVVCNTDEYAGVEGISNKNVNVGEEIIKVTKK